MRLYALNYCTIDTAEGEWDDPSSKESSLEDFASPQVVAIATDATLAEKIEQVKAEAEAERKGLSSPDCPYPEIDAEEYVWSENPWQAPEKGRPHRVFTMYLKEDIEKLETRDHTVAEPIAVLVVQQVEGEPRGQ